MVIYILKEQIQFVSKVSVLIGMYGFMLILVMFFLFGVKLIELFLFGINLDNYIFYRILVELLGMNIFYVFWRNEIEENIVIYFYEVLDVGGIDYFSEEE